MEKTPIHDVENAKIGVFPLVTALPAFASLIFFVALVYFKANAAEVRLDRQADAIKSEREMLIEIREREARIEARLDDLVESLHSRK